MKNKPSTYVHSVKIESLPKSWWEGDPRVGKYMGEVSKAIDRHVSGDARVDIYNRAYEAVYKAILDHEGKDKLLEGIEEKRLEFDRRYMEEIKDDIKTHEGSTSKLRKAYLECNLKKRKGQKIK